MPRRLIAIVPLFLTLLTACGEGYRLVPARLNIDDVAPKSFPAVANTVRGLLVGEGFEDLGKYEEMIALVRQDNSTPVSVKRERLARMEREYTYLSRRHHLRVVLTNYSDGVPRRSRWATHQYPTTS